MTELTSVVIASLVHKLKGTPFYAEVAKMHESRKAAEDFANKGGFVAPMTILLLDWPHDEWYTANTEDISGIDTEGTFGERNQPVVITLHGGTDGNGLLTPSVLETALTPNPTGNGYAGLNSIGTVRLAQAYQGKSPLKDLLEGHMPDGSSVPVIGYDTLVANGKPVYGVKRWAVVRSLDQAKKTKNGSHTLAELAKMSDGKIVQATDSQVIVYNGGVAEATAFLQRLHSAGKVKKVPVYNPFNDSSFNAQEDQARVAYLDTPDRYGLYGDGNVNSYSRFVGVGAGGAVAFEQAGQRILEAYVADALGSGNAFHHKGMIWSGSKAPNLRLE